MYVKYICEVLFNKPKIGMIYHLLYTISSMRISHRLFTGSNSWPKYTLYCQTWSLGRYGDDSNGHSAIN